jgi:uncharacterized membrane protein YvbJ
LPYCPRCGTETSEEMTFCPKCGQSLKAQQVSAWREQWRESRREWRERRRELREQRKDTQDHYYEENWEKTERERGVIEPLIGGVFLIFLGLLFYYTITGTLTGDVLLASFLTVIGLIVIGIATYRAATLRRQPNS